MAKIRFTTNTNEVIKRKYVERKTFKRFLFGCYSLSGLLLLSLGRLYCLGDFGVLASKITTYYRILVKGFL